VHKKNVFDVFKKISRKGTIKPQNLIVKFENNFKKSFQKIFKQKCVDVNLYIPHKLFTFAKKKHTAY
jgi:hypothetical protein